MKRKVYGWLLAFLGAACIALNIVQASAGGAFATAMAFPFAQVGAALRALSLHGGFLNILALLLYGALCLAPAAALLMLRRRRKLFAEDALLALISAALFPVLYYMVNPGLLVLEFGRFILGGAVYSLFFSYLILRALRRFLQEKTDGLMRSMSVMLALLGVLSVILAAGIRFSALLTSIAQMQAGNTGNEHLLGLSYFILACGYLADALPYVLDILVVFSALRLIEAFRLDRYSAGTVEAAERLSRLCVKALAAAVLLSAAFNLLQALLMGSLHVVNITVSVPVFPIAFVLAALLFARLIAQNKQLRDENDAFI